MSICTDVMITVSLVDNRTCFVLNFNPLVTQTGYYHGSTVGPVVGPVFCPFVFVGCLRNFLYELKGDQSWYEKPESGRVCGPKGGLQALLGRP